MGIKGNYKTSKQAMKDITSALKVYYNVPSNARNIWRFNEQVENATKEILSHGEYSYKGAQWGGKWGNFFRAVGLNNKGKYVFVEGFNISKELNSF